MIASWREVYVAPKAFAKTMRIVFEAPVVTLTKRAASPVQWNARPMTLSVLEPVRPVHFPTCPTAARRLAANAAAPSARPMMLCVHVSV